MVLLADWGLRPSYPDSRDRYALSPFGFQVDSHAFVREPLGKPTDCLKHCNDAVSVGKHGDNTPFVG
jgi:hypothetical protein